MSAELKPLYLKRMTKTDHTVFLEHYYGVSIEMLKQFGLEENDEGYIFTSALYNNTDNIKRIATAIREDETGFTAAMYGITNNNEKE